MPVAGGLPAIFGLMDIVNFAYGEFPMVAMYLMFDLSALAPVFNDAALAGRHRIAIFSETADIAAG